jgi:hypothetical protein
MQFVEVDAPPTPTLEDAFRDLAKASMLSPTRTRAETDRAGNCTNSRLPSNNRTTRPPPPCRSYESCSIAARLAANPFSRLPRRRQILTSVFKAVPATAHRRTCSCKRCTSDVEQPNPLVLLGWFRVKWRACHVTVFESVLAYRVAAPHRIRRGS